ncbi:MAG: hypothetical protein QM761_14535 [Pseudoxanthomonas sp.]
MNLLKLGAAMLLTVAATAAWKSGMLDGFGQRVAAAVPERAETGGFVSIPMPDGMPSRGIVIFAPRNCPSEAAQRARDIGRHLAGQRIGYVDADSANYGSLSSQEEANRVMAVMNGPIPIVYVNGRAKANPTPEEVVAEFRRPG